MFWALGKSDPVAEDCLKKTFLLLYGQADLHIKPKAEELKETVLATNLGVVRRNRKVKAKAQSLSVILQNS